MNDTCNHLQVTDGLRRTTSFEITLIIGRIWL